MFHKKQWSFNVDTPGQQSIIVHMTKLKISALVQETTIFLYSFS